MTDGKQNITVEPTIPDQVKAILKTGWKQTAEELPPEGEFVLAWDETIGLYLATWRDLDGVRLWIDCNHEQIDEPQIWRSAKPTKEETDGILKVTSTTES